MDTTGPACVGLGGANKLCGSGAGEVLVINPEGSDDRTRGAIDVGIMSSRLTSLETQLATANALIASLQSQMPSRIHAPNLIVNGDFSDASGAGWMQSVNSPTSSERVLTNWSYPGDAAWEVVETEHTAGIYQVGITVVPGARYTASCFFNIVSITGETGTARQPGEHPLYLRVFNSVGRVYIGEIMMGSMHAGQGWTYAEYSFQVPDGVSDMGVGLYTRQRGLLSTNPACDNSTGCTITVQWDKIALVQQAPVYRECGPELVCHRNS